MVKGTEEKERSLSEWLQIPALANVVLKEKDKRRVLSGKKSVVTTVVTTVYFIFFLCWSGNISGVLPTNVAGKIWKMYTCSFMKQIQLNVFQEKMGNK